jgi:hypothetical protein
VVDGRAAIVGQASCLPPLGCGLRRWRLALRTTELILNWY